jgi:hypothetical protein
MGLGKARAGDDCFSVFLKYFRGHEENPLWLWFDGHAKNTARRLPASIVAG